MITRSVGVSARGYVACASIPWTSLGRRDGARWGWSGRSSSPISVKFVLLGNKIVAKSFLCYTCPKRILSGRSVRLERRDRQAGGLVLVAVENVRSVWRSPEYCLCIQFHEGCDCAVTSARCRRGPWRVMVGVCRRRPVPVSDASAAVATVNGVADCRLSRQFWQR